MVNCCDWAIEADEQLDFLPTGHKMIGVLLEQLIQLFQGSFVPSFCQQTVCQIQQGIGAIIAPRALQEGLAVLPVLQQADVVLVFLLEGVRRRADWL